MGRKMYVYTKPEFLNDFNKQLLVDFWWEVTKKIDETTDDIHTTNIKALHGAQANFDEIFVDGKQLWPNEKSDPCWGQKELRPAHDLSRLIGAWTSYRNTKPYEEDLTDHKPVIIEGYEK